MCRFKSCHPHQAVHGGNSQFEIKAKFSIFRFASGVYVFLAARIRIEKRRKDIEQEKPRIEQGIYS